MDNKQSLSYEACNGFEELLMQISALFINLPLYSIDDVIKDTQRHICECLDLDLSILWQWSDKNLNLLTITHLHAPPDFPSPPKDIDGVKTHPYIYSKLKSGETLAFSNNELPNAAQTDIATRKSFGVESSVAIPLSVSGQPVFGVLTFETVNRSRLWNDREVRLLKMAAEIFANALARKYAEKALRESEARLTLAAESAEAGLWEMDCRTGKFWVTEQARILFDYGFDEDITLTLFEQSVLDEDLENVRQAMADSFEKDQKFQVEYRITDKNGALKWICSKGRPYLNDDSSPYRLLGISVDISERKLLEEELQHKLFELEKLKQQVEQENFYLREDLRTKQGFEHIIGSSKKFAAVLTSARQVAPTVATVLLLGETGTGKGIVANAIHRMSHRKNQPFVTVNCAALPHNLIESELFGREKGAFTGAYATQAGRFQVAHRGTIFLDEIGEMPIELQTKLLRVLQDGEFERLGSPATTKVDVRVVAATGRDLKNDVQEGRFREDLFYRLNVFPIQIPPLRQRRGDIPLLTQHFVTKYSRKMGKQIDRLPKRTLDRLMGYSWPGNVRELEHMIERNVIITTGNTLAFNDQLFEGVPDEPASDNLKDFQSNQRDHITTVLERTGWKIEGPGGAAAILDIHPSTLRFRLKKLGVKRPS